MAGGRRKRLALVQSARVYQQHAHTFPVFGAGVLTALLSPMPPPPRVSLREKRQQILGFLLAHASDGKLEWGCLSQAAVQFGCTRKMVSNVWKEKESLANISAGGRPKVWTADAVEAIIAAVPLQERTTLRSTEAATGISRSTLGRCVASKNGLRRASVSLKPSLTPSHKQQRLDFALSFVQQDPCKSMNLYVFLYNPNTHLYEICAFYS